VNDLFLFNLFLLVLAASALLWRLWAEGEGGGSNVR
jgi:hypothetical protein